MNQENITLLLHEADEGRPGAMDELMAVIYDDLERMARSHLLKKFGERAGRITLEPAGLVNESFLRLIHQRNRYDNRGHFFAIATKVMLRVLIDYQRARSADKRGGGETRFTLPLDDQLDGGGSVGAHPEVDIEVFAAALEELHDLDPDVSDVVHMHVIWGMTIEQIAESLGLSHSTIRRRWRFAKAWLVQRGAAGDENPRD